MEIKDYFDDFNDALNQTLADSANQDGLNQAVDWIRQTKNFKTKILLIGNGGSAAIAEHMATDLTKNAGLRAMTLSGTPVITTFANDFGYQHVYSKAVECYADSGDIVVAISSGGTSPNILNAVDAAKDMGCKVITFSGFDAKNLLRQKGDINIYVPSFAYGYVELIHNLLIHFINDKIIGGAVYPAKRAAHTSGHKVKR